MSVRKLKNGKWVADVSVGYNTFDGKRDRKVKEYRTKREAIKGETLLLMERERTHGRSSAITFQDFVDDVFWPQKQGLRDTTKRCYKRDLKLRLLPTFGQILISEINHYNIQLMISRCATKKVATNARETLSSILGLATDMDMLPKNPASSSSFVYPAPSQKKPDHYGVWLTSFSEHRELLELAAASTPKNVERMLVLGLCFGLRKGEVLGLDWHHVSFERREIEIKQTYTAGEEGPKLTEPKTEKSKRRIPIPRYALERMKAWQKEDRTLIVEQESRGKPVPIVRTRFGTRMHPHSAETAVRRFTNKTNAPKVTMFSLRHSFATASIRSGIDVATVSKWLGHREVSTTYNRYVKPLLTDLHKDVALIDEAYEKSAK